ncbi:MAG TPA: hypothetical protein DD490_10360 [Acidobacteria bacterium]|nr:hypothetical protein [Acidobacteriota bacterium]
MVPGTEGPDVESSPFLLFEENSDTLHLLWQTKVYSVSRISLNSFKEGTFGSPIEVGSGTFNMVMSAPQAAITRDEFFVPTASGGTATVHRTMVHLVWWEEAGSGNEVRYAPITLLEGTYTGWHPVLSLNDLDKTPDDLATAAEVLPQLYRAPRIQTGRNDHTVVVAFANERNGRLTSFELAVLPGEISYLADKIRSHFIELGRLRPPVQTIADKIRSHFIELGRLNPRVVRILGDDIYAQTLAVGPAYVERGDYQGLADAVSNFAAQSATTLLENGRLGEAQTEVLRLGRRADVDFGAPRLQVRKALAQAAPRTAAAPTTIYTSADGKAALVAWDTVNQILYRETTAEGWSEVFSVTLSSDLTREAAAEYLAQRLRR